MRIAVFSDTHNRFPGSLPARLAGADEIWHLGDVCAPETLVEFEQLQIPLRVVMGNCDAHPWPLTLDLERVGVRCHLIHIAPKHPPKAAQLILHGHTHQVRDETDPRGVRWLNPGSVSQPRGGASATFAWLTLNKGQPPQWEVVPL